jgi:FAD/FMN-containing dehydrogenase
MNTPITKLSAVLHELADLECVTDEARVTKLSQDFAWFSPVLKRDLAGLKAQAAVRPKTEEEIRRTVSACARHGVPITARGSATGNYGQCTPLHGGVLLDLSAYNQLLWCKGGVGRAQAGIRMGDFDKQTVPQGWELRCVPSTFRSATLGGLFGGGFGGVGSINCGPLASNGNVLGVRAMTIEPEPKVVELRAPEALLLHHNYGTAGLVLEIEVALAPAHDWLEAIVTFESMDAALECGDALANAPGITKKSVTFFESAVCELLAQAAKPLAPHLPAGQHALVVIVAEQSEQAMQQYVREFGGGISYRKTAAEVKASNRTLIEYTWNHTTLHILKVAPSITYLQSGYAAGGHTQKAREIKKLFGDEVLLHLEFIRTREGAMTHSGLELVRYTTEARLNEIMQIYQAQGVFIANPHVFRVEDGKQGEINPSIVATKARFDPQGLLNPGKLKGWAQKDAILAQMAADEAAGKPNLVTLPRF